MSENSDFQKSVDEQRANRRDQDRDDFNNENAGRDVGRIARFLPKEARPDVRAEKREKNMSEALTRLADTGAPTPDYEQGLAQFTEQEFVNLTLLIGAINVWNRISVGFRAIHRNERANRG